MRTSIIKAMAMTSHYRAELNGDHVCVYDTDKTHVWKNFGRGPSDPGEDKRVVTQCDAYIDWLLKFCPPNDIFKAGIRFGYNGVCQTVANRELLVAENDADVHDASANDMITIIFGKYGCGLDYLEKNLTIAHKAVNGTSESLRIVINRLRNTEIDELLAWKKFLKEQIGMPVQDIISKGGELLKKEAVEEQKEFIKRREAVYKEHQNNKQKLYYGIHSLLVDYCLKEMKELVKYHYVTEEDGNVYLEKLKEASKKIFKEVNTQLVHFEATGTYEFDHALYSVNAIIANVDNSWIERW